MSAELLTLATKLRLVNCCGSIRNFDSPNSSKIAQSSYNDSQSTRPFNNLTFLLFPHEAIQFFSRQRNITAYKAFVFELDFNPTFLFHLFPKGKLLRMGNPAIIPRYYKKSQFFVFVYVPKPTRTVIRP